MVWIKNIWVILEFLGLNLVLTWKNDNPYYKVYDKITYPCPNIYQECGY